MIHRSLSPLLSAALLALTPAFHVANAADRTQAVSVEGEDISIDPHSRWETSVTVPSAPAGHRPVLQFRAWYQAPNVAGYYRTLKVSWERTPLSSLLDRPMTIKTVGGLELDSVTEHGFLTPLVNDPETMRGDPLYMERYRPTGDEKFDFTLFRFALPEADFPGERKLQIFNRSSAGVDYPVMTVRDVQIVFEPIH